VKNTGIEIEGSLSLGAVQLKGTYGYTRARVEDLGPGYTGSLHVGDQVMATPTNTAGALLSATLRQGTTVTAGLAYIGTITQIDAVALFKCLGGTGACTPDFNFVANMPAFTKINAAITQQITRQLDAFLSIDNLANNDGSEGGNFLPAMGRISTLGIRAQL
jgi:outer membrane receptor protein involved in Fe transport